MCVCVCVCVCAYIQLIHLTFRDEASQTGGELFLGGMDPSHYSGEPVCVPLTEENYWKIKIDGYS